MTMNELRPYMASHGSRNNPKYKWVRRFNLSKVIIGSPSDQRGQSGKQTQPTCQCQRAPGAGGFELPPQPNPGETPEHHRHDREIHREPPGVLECVGMIVT